MSLVVMPICYFFQIISRKYQILVSLRAEKKKIKCYIELVLLIFQNQTLKWSHYWTRPQHRCINNMSVTLYDTALRWDLWFIEWSNLFMDIHGEGVKSIFWHLLTAMYSMLRFYLHIIMGLQFWTQVRSSKKNWKQNMAN